jgi:hypothetical protein
MTHRAKCSGGPQAGKFLMGTFVISENNSSPCKQRRKQFSNRDKNGISGSEQTPKSKRKIENRRTHFPFSIFQFLERSELWLTK